MTVRKDTLFEQYLAPVFRFLIDEAEMRRFYESINWQQERDRIEDPTLIYPAYYQTQNFHGIEGGYLTIGAATSYDPITQYVLPPNETWVRQALLDSIRVQPLRILDLGCGTGSTTLMLKQKFPNAEVIGLDLSPYMLIAADQKSQRTNHFPCCLLRPNHRFALISRTSTRDRTIRPPRSLPPSQTQWRNHHPRR